MIGNPKMPPSFPQKPQSQEKWTASSSSDSRYLCSKLRAVRIYLIARCVRGATWQSNARNHSRREMLRVSEDAIHSPLYAQQHRIGQKVHSDAGMSEYRKCLNGTEGRRSKSCGSALEVDGLEVSASTFQRWIARMAFSVGFCG